MITIIAFILSVVLSSLATHIFCRLRENATARQHQLKLRTVHMDSFKDGWEAGRDRGILDEKMRRYEETKTL